MRWAKIIFSSLVALSVPWACSAGADWQWNINNNKVRFTGSTHDDKEVDAYNIRGLSWFGFETPCRCFHGLHIHPFQYYVDNVLKKFGLNSVRIPLEYSIVLDWGMAYPLDNCISEDASFGRTILDNLHHTFYVLRENNISVVLDLHTFRYRILENPYEGDLQESDVLNFWTQVVSQFSQYSNFLGVDLKNEPHGSCTWDSWSAFVQTTIPHILETVPQYRGLFFVEGVQSIKDGSVWGGSFSQMNSTNGFNLSRVVFSPHVYGVSVKGVSAIDDDDSKFNEWFGFLRDQYSNPIVIGEIGGLFIGDDDIEWHQKIKSYLLRENITDSYYWCLNPDSYDTGGILYLDWTGVDLNKIQFMKSLQTNPSFVNFPV